MAVTQVFKIYKRLDKGIAYSVNSEKTIGTLKDELSKEEIEKFNFVSAINCEIDTAYKAMKEAMKLNEKPIKVEGYRIIQSFAENEVDAKTAHEIGVKLATELLGAKY